jgi:hypothetical protein
MLAYVTTLALLATPMMGTLADVVDPGALHVLALAERDFEARRDELGLVGTAPMVGLEPAGPAEDPGVLSDFDSRHEELGTMGAAPLYGLEPIADEPLEQSGEGAPFAEVAR